MKQECYPAGLDISEFKMEVSLQNLLDHTSERLLTLQKDALDIVRLSHPEVPLIVKLVTKYGFDGSGQHPLYSM